MDNKKNILILNGQYYPGYKGGGPIQSCINMVENLSDNFQFYILTADRDYKQSEPYRNIKVNEWNKVGNAKVYYMSPDKQNLKNFKYIINSLDIDLIYLNGFFSPIFTIKPLILNRLRKLKCKNIILTPRGDFTGGCENKKIKKKTYILICKIIRLYSDIIWHATSDIECNDIKMKFKKAKVFTVPNLPMQYTTKNEFIEKNTNELRLVYISRIFPKKNLKFALKLLNEISEGKIVFDIYGPMEDKSYWNECLLIIKEMPKNITVNYKGEIPHSKISRTFSKYHMFLFPTLGENYGHVIVESMVNNCIPILSKGVTPWDDYEEIIGAGASLENRNEFINVIKKFLYMDNYQFKQKINLNNEYISNKFDASQVIKAYNSQFNEYI